METFCSQCQAPLSCQPEGGCWCAELPNKMPVPDAKAGCLCRDCLTAQLARLPGPNLNLWKQRLGRVPEWVWDRTELETLVLAENGLSEVSDHIGRLKNLRMLDLGHNQLAHVPDTLSDLDALTDFLYLHDNQLSSLPDALARLTRLRYLNIGENAFDTLPKCIACMTSLVELRAPGNRLTSLPDCIARLTHLRELHLRDNQLTSLPDSIASLHELRQIDLRGNPITHLPAAIARLPRLEKLDLRWVAIRPYPWFADLEARGCLVYR
jgi:Leucine-rich repeat (LRR) protein